MEATTIVNTEVTYDTPLVRTTKSTIHEQALQQQHALFDQVLPPDRYNNNLQESCYLVDAPAL
ncbi:hypothetical protein MJI46_33960, partial [Salmonella enterica subsp. enterica serovar Cerro]|nr:hypothetical protein [Salmonella enterica subsp. enterica serovar Cerro]